MASSIILTGRRRWSVCIEMSQSLDCGWIGRVVCWCCPGQLVVQLGSVVYLSRALLQNSKKNRICAKYSFFFCGWERDLYGIWGKMTFDEMKFYYLALSPAKNKEFPYSIHGLWPQEGVRKWHACPKGGHKFDIERLRVILPELSQIFS